MTKVNPKNNDKKTSTKRRREFDDNDQPPRKIKMKSNKRTERVYFDDSSEDEDY